MELECVCWGLPDNIREKRPTIPSQYALVKSFFCVTRACVTRHRTLRENTAVYRRCIHLERWEYDSRQSHMLNCLAKLRMPPLNKVEILKTVTYIV